MVLQKITGAKPQEVREPAPKPAENAKQDSTRNAVKASGSDVSVSAAISAKSKAAIKAYRIASESKPDISRAQRVAQIKAQVAKGTYHTSASNVAEAVLKSVVKES